MLRASSHTEEKRDGGMTVHIVPLAAIGQTILFLIAILSLAAYGAWKVAFWLWRRVHYEDPLK